MWVRHQRDEGALPFKTPLRNRYRTSGRAGPAELSIALQKGDSDVAESHDIEWKDDLVNKDAGSCSSQSEVFDGLESAAEGYERYVKWLKMYDLGRHDSTRAAFGKSGQATLAG